VSAVGVTFERAEIEGIPVFWADAPPPFTATLLFRVGRGDETLPTSGLTHLVEHLALFPIGRTEFPSNGMVDDCFTVFYASGTPEQAWGFLRSVARNLGALPLDRLEIEKRILFTENSSGGGGGSPARLMSLRYGARSFGLATFGEYGLRRIEAHEVHAWAQERFVRENAALWLSGPPPESLGLELQDGRRRAPPEPEPLQGLVLPAQMSEGTGGVGIGTVGRRSTALSTGLGIAVHRAHDLLRLDAGLSYGVSGTYAPLGSEVAHLTIGADCLDTHALSVRDEILRVLRELSEQGPSEEELRDARAERARSARDPVEARGWLDYGARQVLLSGDVPSPEDLVVEMEGLASADVAEAISRILSEAIILAPLGTPLPAAFTEYGTLPVETIVGRTYRQTPMRVGRNTKVVASEEGLTLHSLEQPPLTIRFQQCAGLLRWNQNRLTVLALDGSWIELSSRGLRNGQELLRSVTECVPPENVIPMEDVQTLETLIDLAHEKLGRSHVWKEFQRLQEHLLPGERVENLAQLDSLWKHGLLALTDRRLIFLSRGFVGRGNEKRELALRDVLDLDEDEPQARLRRRIRMKTPQGPAEFKKFADARRAGEFWQALHAGAERS